MSVKVKIKLEGKAAKDMVQDPRIKAAFHEVMHNMPRAVKHTEKKFGAKRAHKQEIAIALSKARAAGAHVPNYVSDDALHVQAGTPPGPGTSEVSPVKRVLNPCEAERKRNNSCRDQRTNLGRGKTGIVVAEEENHTERTW